jgi:hypothetical protein
MGCKQRLTIVVNCGQIVKNNKTMPWSMNKFHFASQSSSVPSGNNNVIKRFNKDIMIKRFILLFERLEHR